MTLTDNQKLNVQSFLRTAPWEETCRGTMATVWLREEAIDPECVPKGISVDEVMWWRRAPNGLIPVRIRKKKP
jgi:hypothetical protein